MHSVTHNESHDVLQQKGSIAHTQAWQVQPEQVGVVAVVQPSAPPHVLVPGLHAPFWHTSPEVQAFPSLHGAVLGV